MTPRPLATAPRTEWILGHIDFQGEEPADELEWSIVLRFEDGTCWRDERGIETAIDGWLPLPGGDLAYAEDVERIAADHVEAFKRQSELGWLSPPDGRLLTDLFTQAMFVVTTPAADPEPKKPSDSDPASVFEEHADWVLRTEGAGADNYLEELRDRLIDQASMGVSGRPIDAAAVLFTAAFSTLMAEVGPHHAVGAMRTILSNAGRRLAN